MKNVLEILSNSLKNELLQKVNPDKIIEIRMRIGCPVIVYYVDREIIVESYQVQERDIQDTFHRITGYSAYAFEENIKEGFLSIEGGHRIGFGGQAVIKDGKVSLIKNIHFLNIRVSHSVEGCSNQYFKMIEKENGFQNTLIISPPGLGKTTLLRDIIKNLSSKQKGTSISVIDERNEISGSYQGIPSIDLGIRTDVLTNFSKQGGIITALRSMSPQIIAVDEIGSKEDIEALNYAVISGVKVLATIHGKDEEDVKSKIGQTFYRIFQHIIVIKKRGEYICY